jgi:hypothetical protein
MANRESIFLEITYQGMHCPACQYMEEAVQEVLPQFNGLIHFSKIELRKSKKHDLRFLELSKYLYGEDALKELKLAPIPGLFINGELIFDVIPPRDDLIEAIEFALNSPGSVQYINLHQ